MKRAFLLVLVCAALLSAAEPKVTATHYNCAALPFAAACVENVMLMIEDQSADVAAYKIVTTWKDSAGHNQANVQTVSYGVSGASHGYTFAFVMTGNGATQITVTVSALKVASIVEVRQ